MSHDSPLASSFSAAKALEGRGECTRDYDRHAETSLYDTLTVAHGRRSPGEELRRKMAMYLDAMATPILFDRSINSAATIARNKVDLAQWCRRKLKAYARCLPHRNDAFLERVWREEVETRIGRL